MRFFSIELKRLDPKFYVENYKAKTSQHNFEKRKKCQDFL